jgi:hypothetical protein
MSAFSQELIGRSGYLNEGFADVYDRYRPSPPGQVLDILTVVAGVERPSLVVDLGCGTGLATSRMSVTSRRTARIRACLPAGQISSRASSRSTGWNRSPF